jgi:hypothetical protein
MPVTIARKRPTLDQVRRWPATCTVADAALALGVSRSTLYEALARGERPVQVVTVSRRTQVLTHSLVAALEGRAAA